MRAPLRRAVAALLVAALAWLAGCTARPVDPVDPPRAARGVDLSPDTSDTADTSRHTGDTAPVVPPLVVVILADDLGDNYLSFMDEVNARLVPDSVRFTRAYATVPLCCPVRASFLQGGWYPGQTGVLGNDTPNGGIAPFHDADTLATRLQAAGFATALLGKYLNGYEDGVAPYVPPGWDLFLATTEVGDFTDTQLVRGGSSPGAAGEGVVEGTGGVHLTGWLFEEALAFLDAHPDEPVFLLLAPQSPHIYGTPAAEDEHSWDGFAPRPPAFAEEDARDKPTWIQRIEIDAADVGRWDAETELMVENLEALDRGVAAFLDGLDARGLSERAVVVFTSDNGHLHGEHRLTAKGVAYEEAIRVPLLVRGPGIAPRTEAGLVATNLDLPATIAELSGLPADGEGVSLVPALLGAEVPARDHVFLETAYGNHPVWAGVVTDRWKYVEWGTGETELYDLAADPHELDSLHAAPPAEADLVAFAAWVDEHRALNVTTREVPVGRVGVAYEASLAAWAGVPPLAWAIESGDLPPGLTLAADGVVGGVPSAAGSYTVEVRVTDAGASPVTGRPQTFVQALTFTVTAGARAAGGRAPAAHAAASSAAPGEPPRATAARDGPDVVFLLPGRPGEAVTVGLWLDDTRDGPPVRKAAGRVGVDGLARLRVTGVDPGRTLHWAWTVEGRRLGGGPVPDEDAAVER